MPHKAIAIKEDFSNDQGQLLNYDAYNQAQRFAVPRQKHVDIRSFNQEPIGTRAIMLHFDQFQMEDLSPGIRQVQELEQDVAIRRGEEWTLGTVGKQADRNNWNGISLSCTANATTATQSVIPKVAN